MDIPGPIGKRERSSAARYNSRALAGLAQPSQYLAYRRGRCAEKRLKASTGRRQRQGGESETATSAPKTGAAWPLQSPAKHGIWGCEYPFSVRTPFHQISIARERPVAAAGAASQHTSRGC